jgi:hypothetical protein
VVVVDVETLPVWWRTLTDGTYTPLSLEELIVTFD